MSLKICNRLFDWAIKTYTMGIPNFIPDSVGNGDDFKILDQAIAEDTDSLRVHDVTEKGAAKRVTDAS